MCQKPKWLVYPYDTEGSVHHTFGFLGWDQVLILTKANLKLIECGSTNVQKFIKIIKLFRNII